MKKILIILLISISFSQGFSEEKQNNNLETKSKNKYYKIARSLYQKPFGSTLCIPFIWLGDLAENKRVKSDLSNEQKLEDPDQRRKFNLTNWSQLSLKYFTTNAEHDIEIITGASQDADKIKAQGKFGLNYQHEVTGKISKKLSFNVKDNFFFSEKSHERRNSFLTNDLKLGFLYNHETTYLNFKLNNRYYDPDETNFLSLPALGQHTQLKMVSSAVVHLKQNFGNLNLNVYTNFRDLQYRYVVPIEEEDDEYDAHRARDYDSYTDSKLSYPIMDHLKIFGRVYYKDELRGRI